MTRRPERRAAGEPRPVRGSATARSALVRRPTKRIGLYPGTFDPITNGHLDIIGRAVKLVDKLVIGVAINDGKGPLFTLEERTEMVLAEARKLANGVEIEARPFDNLLMHFAEAVRRPGDHPRAAGGLGLRVRVPDGRHEPADERRDRNRLPDGRPASPGRVLATGKRDCAAAAEAPIYSSLQRSIRELLAKFGGKKGK